MNNKNILFITEGETDEPNFIKKYLKKCIPNVEYNIYSYSTTIHTLAKLLFGKDNEIDEDLNIKNVLKENETDKIKRSILENDYTDIILVFDFEPHCDSPEFIKVGKMLKYFKDSSDMGKLYINYPMMQSYRHLTNLPDNVFKDRKIYKVDAPKYKDIVNNESKFKNINKYNFPVLMKIIGHHLMKANYILNNNYSVPSKEEFYKLDFEKIYKIQMKLNDKEGWIWVLNTFLFFAIEYNPIKIINKINEFL